MLLDRLEVQMGDLEGQSMAVFSVYNNNASFADGFFPAGVEVTQTPNGDTGRDYMFTVGGEARIVRVFWHPDTLNIYAIGLYLADDDPQSGDEVPLGEINDITIPLTRAQFEAAWLSPGASSSAVVALIMGGNDTLNGSDLEDTFVPGLGNDTVFGGGDNGISDYDYVNYAADDRQHGITVDLVDGNAADDWGKVTSRGGVAETDILHSINSVYATAHDDLLIGDNRDNEFYAGFGNDTIYGGDGPVDNFDVLSYRPDGRTQGITVTFSKQGDGTVESSENGGELDTFTGIEAVYGTNHADHFIGAAGSQRFRGFGGNDTFDGGAGNDEVDYRSDATEVSGKAGITIDLSSADENGVVTVTGVNGDTDTLISIERIRGTRNNDTITGNELSNRLRGDNGDDLLIGDAGDDRLEGGAGWDTLDGGIGNDILVGGVGAAIDEDYFLGSVGNDTIFGGDYEQNDDPNTDWNDLTYYNRGFGGIIVTFDDFSGRYGSGQVEKKAGDGSDLGTDTFYNIHAVRGTNGEDVFAGGEGTVVQRFMGFAGDDLFDGTRGINEVDYRLEAREAGRTTGMTIDLSSGDTVEITDAYGDTDTLTLIERLRGTDHGDKLYGNGLNNRLRGDGGDDLVEGRNGFDRLEGGAGNDTLNGGADDDTLLGDAGNDLLNGGVGNDMLIGGAGNDTLNGGEGDDVFEGGEGNDVIDGGPMTETSFDELNYRNVETDGITVEISTLTAFSGTVTNDGSGSQDTFTNINSIVGTRVDDTFVGGIGNHRFVGLAGDDTFVGGSGNTEVDYRLEARIAQWTKGLTIDLGEDLTETVTVKDAMGGTDTLTNIKRIRGTDGSDTISGNALGNRLRGEAGNDVLRGRNGDDALEGGAGTDTAIYSGNRSNYHVENNGTQLTITDQRVNGEGKDTVIDVEFFNFGGTVLNLAEVINHGSAINLAGGMVFENSATGVDIGTLSVANPDAKSAHSYTLADDAGGRFQLASDGKTIEVKNGFLLDFEQAMTHTVVVRATDQFGKSIDQSLTIVLQDVAKESTTGTAGSDTVSGGSGTDNLSGGGGNDNLNGGGGKDKINGGTGNDRIIGGTGQDTLTGGAGKDVFAFANKDTGTSKGTADFITDFSGKGGDKIDLKLIDADTKKKGDQAFSFIGKNAFTKAGQVRYEKTSKETFIYLNTDSDKAAEGVIKLKGAIDLQKGWFVL